MADRTAARIYGDVLRLLAERASEENRVITRRIILQSQEYDFTEDQMGVDEALKILGIEGHREL